MKKSKPRPLTIALMQRVNGLMEKRGISVTDLAKKLGITQPQLSEYLNGTRSAPNGETTLKLEEWCRKNGGKAKLP